MFPVISARQFFTSLRVVAARLLIMVKHHAILLFAAGTILELIERVRQSKAFRHSLKTVLTALAIAPLF